MSFFNQTISNESSFPINDENSISRSEYKINDDFNDENDIEWTEKYLESNYTMLNLNYEDDIIKSAVHYVKKYYKPNRKCLWDYFLNRIPFFKWIRKYDYKEYLYKDAIAGLFVGTIHIPTTMAYSLLAGLPAVNGLYSTFFLILTYIFFGCSENLQTGTFTIIAMLVNNVIEKSEGILYPSNSSQVYNNTNAIDKSNSNYLSNNPDEAKVFIAMSLSFFVGILQISGAFLHLGAAIRFLSDPVINGFACGANYLILVSQLNALLGLKIGRNLLQLAMIGNLIEIFKVIQKTNPAALVISIVSMMFLILSRTQINQRFKKKLPFPIPFELLTIIIATLISYYASFYERWNVPIIGSMPVGFPIPKVPAFNTFSFIIGDCISIAIVSYVTNISIARSYAKKSKNRINENQEFFAYGVGNLCVSFFGGFPGCVALSRCLVFENIGGKTQLSGFFSSALVLIVFLFFGPQLKHLPKCVLSSYNVSILLHKLLDVRIFFKIWKKSKIEALGWLATFMGVIIFSTYVGLYIGLGFSIVLFIFQTQRPRVTILGKMPNIDIYEDINKFEEAKELDYIKIIRYERSVYYANVDNFKYKIIKLSQVDPFDIIEKNKELMKASKEKEKHDYKFFDFWFCPLQNRYTVKDKNQNQVQVSTFQDKHFNEISLKCIILDCSCMNYIDMQGVNCILELHKSYSEIGIKFYLSYCKDSVINSLKKFTNKNDFDLSYIFVTTSFAVRHALLVIQKNNNCIQSTSF